jgi:ABC-type Fe3+ transport system permease subunit
MGHPPASSQDLEHLKLLALFHYILAGITALFSCFPIFHIVIGILIATGSMGETKSQNGPSPQAFGVIFAAFGCAVVAAGWTLATLMFAGGRNIAKRRRHTFCLVVAGLSCLMMPLGTVLGVFTLVVLMRPQVKALFDPPQ